MLSFTTFHGLKDPLSQYTIRFMALFIPHKCPKCFESVTLIQPQHKGGASNAQVLMNSCLGSRARKIDLTPGILSGPGADIVMTQLTCTSPGNTSRINRCQQFNGTAGNDILLIGGTISIPAGQATGVYTGIFDITGENRPAC